MGYGASAGTLPIGHQAGDRVTGFKWPALLLGVLVSTTIAFMAPRTTASGPSFPAYDGASDRVALDQSGDPGPEATYRWTVDTTAPTVTIDDDVKTTPETVEITFEPSESGSTSDCVLLQETDSGLAQLQSVPDCTSPVILQAAQGSKYVVRITATDPAGNKGEPAEKEIDRAVD